MIETLLRAIDLKEEKRTGWELREIDDPESVADHTWGVAFLCLVFGEEDIDIDRALKMALIHDLAEAETGDIPTHAVDAETDVSPGEKEEMETEVIEDFSEQLGAPLKELWEEYEARETAEARFVKDMDMVEMCLQALKYERAGRYDKEAANDNFQEYGDLDEFFATTRDRFSTPTGKELFREIEQKYRAAKQE